MRRSDRENRMNGTKKGKRFGEGLKKAVVYLLCISMIAGSMPAGIALAAENDHEAEETVSEYREEDTSFFLDYDNLYDSIEDALKNDNVTDGSDLNFSGNAKDDYERLFENYGDLYELKPDIETDGEGLSLRVFFRSADGWILSEPEYEEYYDDEEYQDDEIDDEGSEDYEDYEDYEEYYDEEEYELTYELTGNEDIIFLLINDDSEEKSGRVYIDDEYATPVITVAPHDEADNVSTVSSATKSYSSSTRSESSSSAVRSESSSSAARAESSSNSSGRGTSVSEETSEGYAEDDYGLIAISGILYDTVILNDTSSAASFVTTTADLGMAYGIMTLAAQTVTDVNGITYTYETLFNLWIWSHDSVKIAGYSHPRWYYGDKNDAVRNEVLSYKDTDGEVYYLIPEKYFSENLKSYGYDFDENRDNDVCPFRYIPNAHQFHNQDPVDKAEYYPVTLEENGKETTTWYVRVQDTTGMKPHRCNVFYYPVYEEIEFQFRVYDKNGTEVASHSSPDIKDAIEYLDNGTTYYLIPVEYFEEDLKKYGYEFSEELAEKYCPFRYVPNANTNATLEAATGKAEYQYLYMEENGEEVKKWYLSVQDTTGLSPHRSNIFYTPADGKFVLDLGNGNGTGNFADHSVTSGATSRYTLPVDPDDDLTAYENDNGTVTVNLPSDSDLGNSFTAVSAVNGQPAITITPVNENDYYKLVGWINIATGEYYNVSDGSVSVGIDLADQNVFYADWVAKSYDLGSSADGNQQVGTERLADMMTIRMYDYNELFNLYSAKLDQNGSDSEAWSDSLQLYDAPYIADTGGTAITDSFIFSNESTAKEEGMLENMNDRSAANTYVGAGNPPLSAADSWDITSPDSAPLNMLFDQTASSLGVNYLGEADYLFIADDDYTDDPDGYYYFNSKDSSVVYNQTNERFYVYGRSQTVDGKEAFLPYNDPGENLSSSAGEANYWFGMDMEINFNLSYDAGSSSTETEDHDYFNIAGEDDILIFLDDELFLDMSGIHDESYGAIDFTTGTVKLAMSKDELESMEGTTFDLEKGNHTLRIFYVNRSARGSDLEIEFDLDPFTYYPIDHEIIPNMSDPPTTVKEKAIGEDTAINMEMTAKLPRIDTKALSDTENSFKLLFHETMDNGLELQNSGSNIAVYLRTDKDNPVDSEYYEIVPDPDDECTFHVTVDLSALYSADKITADDLGSTELIIVFSVDLPEEITYGSYKSTAWYEGFATYRDSEESVQEFLSRQDSVELYSYGIAISKYDIGQLEGVDYEGAAIPGAEFTLFKDEACTEPVLRGEDAYTDFSGDDGKVFFYGLADGTYYVKETGIPEGYIAMSEVTEITLDEGLKLEDFDYIYETEIPNMPSIDITGRKIWDDDDDEDGDRPDSITLRLYGDGLAAGSMTVTAEDYWSYEFTGLPMYDSKLEVITYTLTEDAISGYTPAYNEYDFTNTHTPEMTSVFVTIRWEDDTKAERPESITLELYMNGEATGITMTLSADNKWTGIFTGLYEYNEGILNVYTVQEAEIEGYITTVSGDATTGFVVTNAHVPYGTEPGPDQGPIPKGTEPGPVYGGSGSGSDNDSGGDAYSNNTEVKNGTWILEGALFTYPDGTHPSNEYLNIDGEIWAFYTNGYAVNKKHTQYYTDEAIAAAGNIPTATGTWDVCGWWYEYTDGTYPSNGWARLAYNGKTYWYHFDVDGWMDYGWYYENGNTYYLDSKRDGWRGHMFTGWHEIDGYWYYFSEDGETYGRLVKDTTTPDGYRVDENGRWYE